jgi:hypothetical protein
MLHSASERPRSHRPDGLLRRPQAAAHRVRGERRGVRAHPSVARRIESQSMRDNHCEQPHHQHAHALLTHWRCAWLPRAVVSSTVEDRPALTGSPSPNIALRQLWPISVRATANSSTAEDIKAVKKFRDEMQAGINAQTPEFRAKVRRTQRATASGSSLISARKQTH